MRIITSLLFFFPIWLNAQTLSGIVYQEGTDSVIAKATVYYNGSLASTITDELGRFKLKSIEGKIPVIVSCIGYHSETVEDYPKNETLKVYLKPKINELKEVIIRNDGMTREEKVRQFRKEFLGTSEFALSCTIDNTEDIDLAYSKSDKTLTAYCSEPIQITNEKLGYKVSYYLESFIKSPKNTKFSGNYVFTELGGLIDSSQVIINREKAYRGSRMAFIRGLWSNNLDETGFRILTAFYDPIPADSILVRNEQSQKFINLKSRLLITHRSRPGKITYVSQLKPYAFISEQGFYNTSLQWAGFMTMQRVGDLLPFEYQTPFAGRSTLVEPDKPPLERSNKTERSFKLKTKSGPSDLDFIYDIVLSARNPLDHRLIVKKWQTAISYKVHGSFRQISDTKITEIFKDLSTLTGLEITKATDDNPANFLILNGGNPNRFKDVISSEAIKYLQNRDSDGIYYLLSEEGFSYLVVMVGFRNKPSSEEVYSTIKKRIIKGFGFFGTQEKNENSIFYNYTNRLPDTIAPYDQKIIKTLYNTNVKSGMSGYELKAVLGNIDK